MILADALTEVMSLQSADHRRAALIISDGKPPLQCWEIEAFYEGPDFPECLSGE